MLHQLHNDSDVLVAHFNHNIRPNSADDQAFVARLAKQYGLDFATKDANLGSGASEADARKARYDFLFTVCQEKQGKLYVAHHRDDVYESIAINILRGTGWRGLAPFRDQRIERPLLNLEKRDIYTYATKHQLTFRQDQTNTEDNYLRNRIRSELRNATKGQKEELYALYARQCIIANEIDQILTEFASKAEKYIPRDIFSALEEASALELLRELLRKEGISQTRPQLRRALDAINTYQPGKQFPLGKNACIRVAKNNFSIKKLMINLL